MLYVAPLVIAYRLLNGSDGPSRTERLDDLERRVGRLDRRVEELDDRVDGEE